MIAAFSRASCALHHVRHMRALCEHRGVVFSIPHNDDGVWHYKIYTKRDRRTTARGQPQATPVGGFADRESAEEAAKKAIDAWLSAL